MKKLILLLILTASVAIKTHAQKPATFKFEALEHDFGKIAKDKPVTFEFKFTNSGDVPIIISNAIAQCGCTTPELTPKAGIPIKKGEKGIVKVTFNAATDGIFTKLVTLNSNVGNAPMILTIKGEVSNTVASKNK